MRAWAILAFVVLGGCLEAGAPASPLVPNPSVTQEVPPPHVEVKEINFTVRGTSVIFNGDPNGGDVSVPVGALEVIAEARWSCVAGPCEMHLIMIKPGNGGSESVQGDSRAKLIVQDLRAGTWNAQVRPVTFVNAAGLIRVSVFTGGVAPPDYTAFSPS